MALPLYWSGVSELFNLSFLISKMAIVLRAIGKMKGNFIRDIRLEVSSLSKCYSSLL
jgi:hypothetical protein